MTGSADTALVVGGGIAGLAAAASMLQQGWSVTVLEQAPTFSEVGAGLALTANGLSALAVLGLDETARTSGHKLHMSGTMDERGNWLMRIPRSDPPYSAQQAHGVHRRVLHQLLLGAAEGARLVTGTRITTVNAGHPAGSPAKVQGISSDGPVEYEADVVIGADGLRSQTRHQLAPATVPEYSGKSSWRGIVEDASVVTDDFIIRWGPGTEFGAVRISDDQVYWYGYTHSAEDRRRLDEKAAAIEHFKDWSTPVPALIRATPPERILRHDVYSLAPPLHTYVFGRTVLIGDAAHAMVPTMGQGANSSLEDGVCAGLLIARAVNAGTELSAALKDFDSQRRPRTQHMARRSQQTGRIGADIRRRSAVGLRNRLMKLIPAGPAAAAGASILSWKPPAATNRPRHWNLDDNST